VNTACLFICLWAKNPHPNNVDTGKNRQHKVSLRHLMETDSDLKFNTHQCIFRRNIYLAQEVGKYDDFLKIMFCTTQFSNSPLRSAKGLLLHLSLTLCLLYVGPAQARDRSTRSQGYQAGSQIKDPRPGNQHDEWITFPYTIQFSPYIGLTQAPSQLAPHHTHRKESQYLRVHGANVDIGVTQIRHFIWKHFHCYPKLGVAFNYGWLEKKGYLAGGYLYLEPRYDYLATWEVSPRLGIGIVHAKIPRHKSGELASEDDTTETSHEILAEDIYQQGSHLDLSLTLAINISLTPHWQLSPSLGYNYMPLIANQRPQQEAQRPQDDTALKIITAGIGLSYTPNPSIIRYTKPDIQDSKASSRIDIGFLNAPKKFMPSSQKNTDGAGKYYYVGGVYGQASLQVSNSHALTLATEWISDGAERQALKEQIKKSPLQVGLLLGHEFRWGKCLFGQQIGMHMVNNDSEVSRVYARLGITYRLTDAWFVGLNLKAIVRSEEENFSLNSIQRDFIDFRMGYSF
jgi:hypothetical protein